MHLKNVASINKFLPSSNFEQRRRGSQEIVVLAKLCESSREIFRDNSKDFCNSAWYNPLPCLSLFSSHGYSIFFSLHKPHWQVLSAPPTEAPTTPTEHKDNSPPSEAARGSRHASVTHDVTRPEEEESGDDDVMEGEEVKSEYECVVT